MDSNFISNKREALKSILYIVLLLVFVVVSIYYYKRSKSERNYIFENGISTTGIVVDVWNSTRGTKVKFEFIVNQKIYKGGHSTYNDVHIGEKYEVLYNSKNPKLNYMNFDKIIANE